jgi:hypothetical protein
MFEIFSTREIAIGIWALISITVISLTSVRKSFSGVLSAFLNPKILITIAWVVGYVACCIWLLYSMKLWTASLLKDTILWVIFVGIGGYFGGNGRAFRV